MISTLPMSKSAAVDSQVTAHVDDLLYSRGISPVPIHVVSGPEPSGLRPLQGDHPAIVVRLERGVSIAGDSDEAKAARGSAARQVARLAERRSIGWADARQAQFGASLVVTAASASVVLFVNGLLVSAAGVPSVNYFPMMAAVALSAGVATTLKRTYQHARRAFQERELETDAAAALLLGDAEPVLKSIEAEANRPRTLLERVGGYVQSLLGVGTEPESHARALAVQAAMAGFQAGRSAAASEPRTAAVPEDAHVDVPVQVQQPAQGQRRASSLVRGSREGVRDATVTELPPSLVRGSASGRGATTGTHPRPAGAATGTDAQGSPRRPGAPGC